MPKARIRQEVLDADASRGFTTRSFSLSCQHVPCSCLSERALLAKMNGKNQFATVAWRSAHTRRYPCVVAVKMHDTAPASAKWETGTSIVVR
jgi:hypothetical protein